MAIPDAAWRRLADVAEARTVCHPRWRPPCGVRAHRRVAPQLGSRARRALGDWRARGRGEARQTRAPTRRAARGLGGVRAHGDRRDRVWRRRAARRRAQEGGDRGARARGPPLPLARDRMLSATVVDGAVATDATDARVAVRGGIRRARGGARGGSRGQRAAEGSEDARDARVRGLTATPTTTLCEPCAAAASAKKRDRSRAVSRRQDAAAGRVRRPAASAHRGATSADPEASRRVSKEALSKES